METITLKKLCDYPEFLEKAAFWFSQKWDVPVEEYKKVFKRVLIEK